MRNDARRVCARAVAATRSVARQTRVKHNTIREILIPLLLVLVLMLMRMRVLRRLRARS